MLRPKPTSPQLEYASTVWNPVTDPTLPYWSLYSGVSPGFAAMTATEPAPNVLFHQRLQIFQIFRNCQCLNDLRVRTYDLGTLSTLLYKGSFFSSTARIWNGLSANVIASTLDDFKLLVGAGITVRLCQSWPCI